MEECSERVSYESQAAEHADEVGKPTKVATYLSGLEKWDDSGGSG